jgi:magnesium chelatase family protein
MLDPAPPPRLGPVATEAGAASAAVRERVIRARHRALERLSGSGALANAAMGPRLTRATVRLEPAGRDRLLESHRARPLTARGQDRVLRLARTIADLDASEHVLERHVDEAIGYRMGAAWRRAA